MIDFLQAGKGIYIEGNDFMTDHENSSLASYTGCSLENSGKQVNNISTVHGESETLTNNLVFDYQYGRRPDYGPDILSAEGGVLLFSSQEGGGRVVCSGKDTGWKFITSSLAFGGLINASGENTKKHLMSLYLDYLPQETSVCSRNPIVKKSSLVNYPNPCSETTTLEYTVVKPQILSLSVYTIQGRLICKKELGYNGAGTFYLEIEVSSLRSGRYFYKLQGNKQMSLTTMTVAR